MTFGSRNLNACIEVQFDVRHFQWVESRTKKTSRWSIGQQDGQARKDEQKKSDELENDDTRMVLVQFSRSNYKFKLFKYRDTLRVKGIRISNDLSYLQRQQLKEVKKKGLIGYFKNGQLCTKRKSDNSRIYRRTVRRLEMNEQSDGIFMDIGNPTEVTHI